MVAVALLGAGAACGRKSPGPDGARLSVAPDGAAHVVGAAGARLAGGESGVLRAGDVVHVDRGMATVELRDDVVIELRKGSELRAGARPELVKGDALVVTKRTPAVVRAGSSTVEVSGVGRITNGLGLTAGSYRGKVLVESAGKSLTVPALRRTAVPGLGLVPSRPVPLTIDAKDVWDRRYLDLAIEWGDDLKSYSNGFTNQVAGADAAPLVAELVPEGSLLVGKAGRRPAGELLVGVAIAAAGPARERVARVDKVFRFRDERASWGLVVLDQALSDPNQAMSLVRAATKQWASRVTARLIMGEVARSFETGPLDFDEPAPSTATAAPAPAPSPSGGSSTPPTTTPPSGGDGGTKEPTLPVPLQEAVGPIVEPVLGTAPAPVREAVDAVGGLVSTTVTTLPKL